MKIAVVTGTGKGLGRKIAKGLGTKGFVLLVTDIDEEAARDTASAIGGGAWAMRQEVRDPASHHEVARAAIEAMRAQGGHLINIASLWSIVPVPGLAVYGATKQAVLGFTVSLAGDIDRAGLPIEVSAVCPDGIDAERASKFSVYDFRQSLATELTERSGNLFGVGYLLGHKHVTTTNHYVHARRPSRRISPFWIPGGRATRSNV